MEYHNIAGVSGRFVKLPASAKRNRVDLGAHLGCKRVPEVFLAEFRIGTRSLVFRHEKVFAIETNLSRGGLKSYLARDTRVAATFA
jgi:hypothetical protein